jgi:hypothetical protein
VNRIEMDELWSFVGKKQARTERHELFAKGDQYVFIAIAGTQKATRSLDPRFTYFRYKREATVPELLAASREAVENFERAS